MKNVVSGTLIEFLIYETGVTCCCLIVLLSDSAAYPTITHNDVIVSLERRCTSLTVKLDELEVAPASQRETFIQ